MNKNYVIIGIVVVLIAAVGYFTMNSNKSNSMQQTEESIPTTTEENTSNVTMETKGVSTGITGSSSADMKEAKTFIVDGSNFTFSVKEIKVNKGDTVKVVFNNKEGTHDWNLDEFNAHTKKIGEGQSDTVTFVAEKAGTFEYYCSVGQHRQMGMKGNLIVE